MFADVLTLLVLLALLPILVTISPQVCVCCVLMLFLPNLISHIRHHNFI